MKQQRLRADNYEQLIEIVKAVQRGKNPEEALYPKEPQNVPDEEQPERSLDEKLTNEELLRPEQPEMSPDEELTDEELLRSEQPEMSPVEEVTDEMQDIPDEGLSEEMGWKESILDRVRSVKESFEWRFSPKEFLGKLPLKKMFFKKAVSDKESTEEESVKDIFPGAELVEVSLEDRSEKERAADEQSLDRLLNSPEEKTTDSEAVKDVSAAADTSSLTEQTVSANRQPGKLGSFVAGLRDYASELRGNLAQKGFQRKESILFGMGALLAILVVAVLVHGISVSRAEKRKMEHVAADEGLTVLVEDQPQQWCSSYPVQLIVRTKNETIAKVSVNGTDYIPDENGQIIVESEDPLLEVSVAAEQGTLKAQVEIPLIDAQAPVVNIARTQDEVTVTANDARSEISKIRYAVVHNNAYLDFPLYQDYSEPLTFEEDCIYYFYAQDAAGNRSVPTVTTMETAKQIELPQEELSLFPDEAVFLNVRVEPDGALLNNLRYSSANTDVITVDSFGRIIAVSEGSTVITVSADDVSDVSCKVTVSQERAVTISAIGDCTLGTDAAFNPQTSFNAFDTVRGHSWFFQNVSDILGNDDVTFANLEGTFTTSTERAVKEYAFKGDPSYTQILTNGSIEVVTLANNHSSDYGTQSLTDTKQYLAEAGIDYCQDTEIVVRDVNDIRTAFVGIYVLDDGMASETDLREAIASAQEQKAQIIIVAFHWGSEKATQPDEIQQALAHTAIDCGADLVVGHHPHVLQGIEKYNGKYIVYSLGNFCFGGNSAPSDMDTMIFRQTFTVTQDGVLDDDQIDIIPCTISSEPYYNNYQPTPAEGTEAERIIGRINEYSSPFGLAFSASDGQD